jgi:hypothetical protein
LVKALAAGALLVAAALPLAIAGVAEAAGAPTVTSVTFNGASSFGSGATGSVAIVGTNLAADGGNVTVTSNAPGLTFTGAAESSNTAASATFASTAATVPGSYSITVKDDAGTATLPAAFTVNAAPSITSATPAVLSDGNGTTTVTLAGGSFVSGATVTLTSDVNGTTMTVGSTTVAVGGASLTVPVTPTNSVTSNPATAGTYDITVTNPDGGTSTLASAFTITAYGITALSPSALAAPSSGTSTTTITVSGTGFEYGATIVLSGCTGVTPVVTPQVATVASATSLSFTATVATGTAPERCGVTVQNPSVGGNDATFSVAGGFGVGEAGSLAPIVTASSLAAGTGLNAGDPASTVTFTGAGFSQYTIGGNTYDSTGATDADSTVSDCTGTNGTTLTCSVTVVSGAVTGAHTAELFNDGAEGDFAAAFTVAGPAITSAAPAALAVGAPVGTVMVLTGTGFTNTTQGSVIHAGTLNGVFQYVSATTEDFVVTASPDQSDATGPDSLQLTSVDGTGATVKTPAFALSIDSAPSVLSLAYSVTGTHGVGVGATAQTITITGTHFATGVTVGGFANGNGVADPDVVATVTSVNLSGTVITATIAIAAGDVNPADGYTVTNLDGGVAKVSAIQPDALVIDAGPTVTAASPATGLASATTAFTLTGTGFETGAVVSATSNGTCSPATVVSATSITVSCTLGAAQTTTTSLVVTNPDGGSATSAVVLPAASTKPPVKPFHVSGVHGRAIVGQTVNLTVTGTGFHGQPRITSSAPGTRAVVSRDTGTTLVVRVTTKATTKPGAKVLTISQGGKVGKGHYSLIK